MARVNRRQKVFGGERDYGRLTVAALRDLLEPFGLGHPDSVRSLRGLRGVRPVFRVFCFRQSVLPWEVCWDRLPEWDVHCVFSSRVRSTMP